MSHRPQTPPILKNQKGLLTLDFIFSLVMFFAFTTILFCISMTFTVVELGQYISFSSARNFSLAHSNRNTQVLRGKAKYAELLRHPAIAPLISNEWFRFGDIEVGDFGDEMATQYDRQQDSVVFSGARIPFSAPILVKRFPLFGMTAQDPDGFSANIQSFTSREPTQLECFEFIRARGAALTSLGYRNRPDRYIVQWDNGC